jgi:acetyl/propionyl-CoA carboxylase alpha subunit/acetyl-CoA carboxylase carboxyltransferase component
VQGPFRRLAIVNRGEPAMRCIRAVRELNEEHGNAIRTIALYTEPERRAMFAREADEAVLIGPAAFLDRRDGERKNGYLDYDALERALVAARADAAWVGWGFVSEHAEFAELCERLGIVFVGPPPAVTRAVGDKIGAKLLAEEAGVPVAPWSGGAVDLLDDAHRAAESIGYPLLVKASAGGGGRGIRRVDRPEDLERAFESARSEALVAFGDPTVFLEQLVRSARHVEVQIIADGHGNIWPLGVRDCSVQRRNQKVIEESSCTVLTEEQDRELREAAVRLARVAGYRNAGTVEFLYQPETQSFSFMEVNARLQVEHPVTELTTGVDIVKLQLDVAAGGRLEGHPPPTSGHAIEVRLNAEDPEAEFAPAPGTIELLRLPAGPGVRVDAGVSEGDLIPAEFDSMIAKIMSWGRTRPEALARLRRALAETTVVVRGGTTNQGFLLDLLDHPDIRSGAFDNRWLDRLALEGGVAPTRHADVALVQAAVDAADEAEALDRARFFTWARRGRPQADEDMGRTVDLAHRGHRYRLVVFHTGPGRYRVQLDDASSDVQVERLSDFEGRLTYAGTTYRTVSTSHGGVHLVEVDGVTHRISRDDGGIVRAPAPAVVASIDVEPGEVVEAGDRVAVVESMKMEMALRAPMGGRVREVLVSANVQVDAGAPILQIEVVDGMEPTVLVDRIRLHDDEVTGLDIRGRCRANADALIRLVLGFDVPDVDVRRVAEDQREVCRLLDPDDPELLREEQRVLTVFADLRRLTRSRHDVDDVGQVDDVGEATRSPQEYFNAYLRSLDADVEGLPRRYVRQLQRALSHYGVDSLDRTPQLERALYRMFRAQQHIQLQVDAVMAILDRRLESAEGFAGRLGPEYRDMLDHLIDATSWRDPTIADVAREVRFRFYDEPMLRAGRDALYAEMEAELEELARGLPPAERDVHIARLVECPLPMAPMLTARLASEANHLLRDALLEVMTRRYYRMRELEHVGGFVLGGRSFVTAQHGWEGGWFHLVTTQLELSELDEVAETVATHAAVLPPDHRVVIDFYARQADHPSARLVGDELADLLAERLRHVAFPPTLHRVVVAVADADEGPGMSAVQIFTFRPDAEGRLVEDRPVRGLHPLMAKRLQLWRFSNFDLERLPSAEDVYLFRGVAKENPRDERLFAVAEVRDLTPVRNERGRVVGVPQLEYALAETLEGIRRFQARRPPDRRLHWNRVFFYVWPPIELSPEEIRQVMRQLARSTAGLGIEVVNVRGRLREGEVLRERVLRFSNPTGSGVMVEVDDPPAEPLRPLDAYTQKVVQARRRGTVYPYELIKTLAPAAGDAQGDLPPGSFVEYDLPEGADEIYGSRLEPVDRPPGQNRSGIIVGVVTSFTERYPEGMRRVAIFGDPTRALGSIAVKECVRINAALDLAEELGAPVEWFALSAGAKIAMDSGTENMDGVAAVLRRLIEFTQAGHEVNVVVAGINVGAQPYWNAEATMLMHTKGILVMTPESAMVLTGKQALDYSGGVSADDNFGIGGYERIMGPNGQAQYWAPDLAGACRVLLAHYEHAYVAPGERFPRRAPSIDPVDRDVRDMPHHLEDSEFVRVGEIFSEETNPERKLAFDIRTVMRAVIDQDLAPMERWGAMAGADTAVVWDAHIGGWPVTLLGIESHPLDRRGPVPADGPARWTSGTLFPRSSKKIARAINASSGSRPVVVLANLSGFDGSPDSMRSWQLEFGAEIGRAVVNFDGPIVFSVVSRFHGGAFVVFSQRLNDHLETVAIEGSHASVIGGAPAAAVVFAGEVDARTRNDPRVLELEERLHDAEGVERSRLRAELAELRVAVRSEKLGELATEFDTIHSVERAQRMGSVRDIIPAARLRPHLVEALERGMSHFVDP